jgi:hypothetical protein
MKTIIQTIITMMIITCSMTFSYADIPDTERQALIDLYNSTGGDNWKNNTGWKGEAGTECNWFMISCNNEKTHVVGIDSNPNCNGDCSGNNLTGKILQSIENLNSISRIKFSGDNLTSLPAEIGNLTNLTYLYLYTNDLTSLPAEIVNLTNLTTLDLDDNNLTSVPAVILKLTNLTRLDLNRINLTSVPPEIGNLINLTTLDLSSNELTSVPPEIGNLTNLTTLYLHYNDLTSVPPEIGNLTNLTTLYLNSNDLTSVPPEIVNLTNLTTLGLNGNMLTSLPSDITQLTKLNDADFDCNALEISDTKITQFLDAKQSNWRQTQTVSPKQLTITTITGNAISLTWSPIEYISHQGGYEVYYSPSDNDSYTIYDITKDKTIEQMTISGLHPDTIYYFKLRTVTAPHTYGNWYEQNPNTVYSQFTPDISARTLPLIAMAKQSLSGVMNDSSISIDITGSGADFYIYKLNQNEWSEDFPLNTPITLNSLEDGPYTLLIKGRSNDGSLQNSPSVYTWFIDTKAEPPDLILPSNWDTGTYNNDQITNATQLTLTGTCEKDATIEFFDNIQHIDYQNITFDNNTFTATFRLTKGSHAITAIQTDSAGNKSQPSTALEIHIDTQVDNFSIDESIIDSPCLWALTPQNITLTGTREAQSTLSINTDYTNTINITYPDNQTCKKGDVYDFMLFCNAFRIFCKR